MKVQFESSAAERDNLTSKFMIQAALNRWGMDYPRSTVCSTDTLSYYCEILFYRKARRPSERQIRAMGEEGQAWRKGADGFMEIVNPHYGRAVVRDEQGRPTDESWPLAGVGGLAVKQARAALVSGHRAAIEFRLLAVIEGRDDFDGRARKRGGSHLVAALHRPDYAPDGEVVAMGFFTPAEWEARDLPIVRWDYTF